MMRQLNQI
jgi:hypothetical protein